MTNDPLTIRVHATWLDATAPPGGWPAPDPAEEVIAVTEIAFEVLSVEPAGGFHPEPQVVVRLRWTGAADAWPHVNQAPFEMLLPATKAPAKDTVVVLRLVAS